jgi:predicted TIM-barrel fold metal-dependent hydrolase
MAQSFAFSAGKTVAETPLPAGACDCHVHMYDSRYPAALGAALQPPPASIAQYRQIQRRIRTSRAVLVTPSTYGANNEPMLAGLKELGPNGRGVAVINGDESQDELQRLSLARVRGIRVNLSHGVTNYASDIGRLAVKIAPLGWHLQLLMATEQLGRMAPLLRELPVNIVLDHFARISPRDFLREPTHALVLNLLAGGRTWVKLSGGYLVSPTGSVEDPALDGLARSFIEAAPSRVVWGSDWPHATASAGRQPMPDDARQIDRLAHWAGDDATLRSILVDNPEALYGFSSTPREASK